MYILFEAEEKHQGVPEYVTCHKTLDPEQTTVQLILRETSRASQTKL